MANRVFMSFAAEDEKQVRSLRLLSSTPNYAVEFYEESLRVGIRNRHAEYIKSVIRRKINSTTATVCLVGERTFTSPWVNWDLHISLIEGHKLLAMYLKNATGVPLPEALREANTYCWEWDPRHLDLIIKSA